MIKDRLTEAVEANYEKILKGDDHVPIGMRGELEVIVKDRDGNIKSYERDHNQVTKLAKMALLHLLAGEIGTVDTQLYSVAEAETFRSSNYRTFSISSSGSSTPAVVSSFTADNHIASNEGTKNLDGQLVSGSAYFYNGSSYVSNDGTTNRLSQVNPEDISGTLLKFNFPTKMLFGTGLESTTDSEANLLTLYNTDMGSASSSIVTLNAINILNGYSNQNSLASDFFKYCSVSGADASVSTGKVLSNWYSGEASRCRTLQPASTTPMSTLPTANNTSIKGAIKDCFISDANNSTEVGFYNPTTKMAKAPYRGYGNPCFIYATRNTQSFYTVSALEENTDVYYQMNDALVSVPYETEVTYTVVMPAQPVASNSITTFYPYNGWVLRQAGLFCDSRYKIRSNDSDSTYGEAALLSKANSGSEDGSIYRDSVGGMMLFTRNLSSPILKTADDEVTFIWHIFITV